MIISKTPFRISFFGGGTDYPPWFREHGGKVLASAIDKYCYISCRYLPPFFEHKYRVVYSKIENVADHADIQHPAVREVLAYMGCERGLEIHHDGDLPARSGLGSSSSFTVGLLNVLYALRGQHRSAADLAKEAIHIEQDIIREHVGSQDQISAAFGGFNRIEFFPDDRFDVSPILLPEAKHDALQEHFMLVFTGLSRYASEVAKSKIENFDKRKEELRSLGEMVDAAIDILTSTHTPIEEFGCLLHEAWTVKRQLSDKVTNSTVDEIYEAAREAGAGGGKLLGAGGGGFLLLFVPPERQFLVRERLNGLIHVPFRLERSGSRIVLYQPDGLK